MRLFPDDLAQAQQERSATYRQLAERPGRTELCRRWRLYRLPAQPFFHPWERHRRPSPAAWWEPRDLERPDGDVSERLQR